MDEGGEDELYIDENGWKQGKAERIGWLIDGGNYFRALRYSLEAATHEILIVGWDIDSTVELLRDHDHPLYPSPLAETLERLVEDRPGLCVHVLSWDFAWVYVLERELLPALQFGWQDSERLHFKPDRPYALGASHHQKYVVIDGVGHIRAAWISRRTAGIVASMRPETIAC
jgi:phosphatidylserine/phosphatidylglycerophosphate/cardiolipin synthase-like enzyme